MAGNLIPEGSFWARWPAVPSAAAGSGVAAVLRVRAAVKTMASGDLGGPRPSHPPRPRHLKETRSARASAGECARLPVASFGPLPGTCPRKPACRRCLTGSVSQNWTICARSPHNRTVLNRSDSASLWSPVSILATGMSVALRSGIGRLLARWLLCPGGRQFGNAARCRRRHRLPGPSGPPAPAGQLAHTRPDSAPQKQQIESVLISKNISELRSPLTESNRRPSPYHGDLTVI